VSAASTAQSLSATQGPGSTAPAEPRGGASTAPALRIESGNPTAEELAAIVVLLSALGGGEHAPAGRWRSAWADPAWHLVGPTSHVGGWRASALPR
jgi:hypothetical protein